MNRRQEDPQGWRGRAGAVLALAVFFWAALAGMATAAVEHHPLPDVDALATSLLFEPDGDLRFYYGGDGNNGSSISKQIGRLTPDDQLTLDDPYGFGFGPTRTTLALAPDGGLWAVERSHNGLHRLAPDGTVTRKFVGPDSLIFTAAATGPDGVLYTGTAAGDIFRHSVAENGSIETEDLDPPSSPGNAARGLTFLNGRIYLMANPRCQEDNCEPARLIEIDPAAAPGEQRRETPIPAFDHPAMLGVAAGPDGHLWITDGARPRTIRRFTPAGAEADTPLTLPPGASAGLSSGLGDSMLARTDEGALARIRPDGTVTEWCPLDPALVEQGAGHYYLRDVVAGPGGDIWFSARGEIGRLTLDTPALTGCAPAITDTSVEIDDVERSDQVARLHAGVLRGGGRLPDATRPADPEIPGHGVRFELGTTTEYGRTIPAPAPFGVASYGVALDDLEPGQTYHFRAVVTTRFGTAYGPDTTFTMPPPPSVQITGERVEGGYPVIDVTVDPGGSLTDVEIEYGPAADRGYSRSFPQVGADSGPQKLTLRMDGGAYDLRAHREFHYRVVATNSRGTTASEARMIPVPPFQPPPPDNPPPNNGNQPPNTGNPPSPQPSGSGSGPVTPVSPVVTPGGTDSIAPPADVVGPAIRIPASAKTITATRSGSLRFPIGPVAEDTTGVLALKTAGKIRVRSRRRVVFLGSNSFQALKGQTAGVRFSLSKANRSILRKAGRLRVQANVTLRDARGNATVKTFVFTLRLPKQGGRA